MELAGIRACALLGQEPIPDARDTPDKPGYSQPGWHLALLSCLASTCVGGPASNRAPTRRGPLLGLGSVPNPQSALLT